MLSENEKSALIQQIEQNTGLVFLEEPVAGNLCYVHNNEDLRDEFKQFFTAKDFGFYQKAFKGETAKAPKDKFDFWLLVEKGRN